jgi:KEOPS complex subunit Cgi121
MLSFEALGATGRIDDIEHVVSYFQRAGGKGAAMDADLVCGVDHLISAALHALRAWERGESTASSIGMEAMLYASGERQISKAISKMGLKAGGGRVALLLFGIDAYQVLADLGLERDDEVLRESAEKVLRFGITEKEIEAVGENRAADLVLERVASVDLIKR